MKRIWTLGLLLALAACAKDPRAAVDQALAAGDRAQARSMLDAALAKAPDRADLHALRYVMARDESVNGAEDQKGPALDRSIAEYEWLAAHFKQARDYGNGDANLRADPAAKALLDEAGKSLYH